MSILPAGYPANASDAFTFLSTRERLSIDDIKVLALIEAWGETFYFALADAAKNEEAKALLRRNGQEERGHAHRLLKAITLLGGEPFALPANDQNPFNTPPMRFDGLADGLLQNLEKGEQDGDLKYQTWADAEPNTEVAKLYRQNGSEETRHGQRIAAVKALLQAG